MPFAHLFKICKAEPTRVLLLFSGLWNAEVPRSPGKEFPTWCLYIVRKDNRSLVTCFMFYCTFMSILSNTDGYDLTSNLHIIISWKRIHITALVLFSEYLFSLWHLVSHITLCSFSHHLGTSPPIWFSTHSGIDLQSECHNTSINKLSLYLYHDVMFVVNMT